MTPRINTDEVLAALQAAEAAAPSGGKTTREWKKAWGFGIEKTRSLLREAIEKGLMLPSYETRKDVFRPDRKMRVSVIHWKREE